MNRDIFAGNEDTIVALATPQGVGALAIIRLSGKDAISITNKVFKGKNLEAQAPNTVHFGIIHEDGRVIDEVMASVFVAPRSFTKENSVEISCHGSMYIAKEIIRVLINAGARMAQPGEFTRRAFVNGQFDLAQAEAVADLIHSENASQHQSAMQQMRGGFSQEIQRLRQELIHFASLIELELDFSEEDVEFASRDELRSLVDRIRKVIIELVESFRLGNAIKNGVPTVIAGKPNAGKSTLLNTLLNEEKAIVSEIPGTTRDFIEDVLHLEGISFRFIDTAGIREARDKIEAIGVERTKEKMKQAALIIYMFDLGVETPEEIAVEVAKLEALDIPFIKAGNKIDKAPLALLDKLQEEGDWVLISAKQKDHIDVLKEKLVEIVNLDDFNAGDTVVSNLRHYDSLNKARATLDDVVTGINNHITNDFLALDIRQALHYLGEITGEITTEDLLGNIFSKFCIGK